MEPMTQTSGAGDRAVVAAVIERGGLFLAARRTEPPALAGRWEFPGGKAEPGEDDAAALRRECREELGVRIEVGDRSARCTRYRAARWWCGPTGRCWWPGEPAPIESHDELRWLAVGSPEVRELPWLEGDYVILDALEQEAGQGTAQAAGHGAAQAGGREAGHQAGQAAGREPGQAATQATRVA